MGHIGIGERIREARQKKGLSVRQLATYADVDERHIRRLEAGTRRTPRFDTFLRLQKVLGPDLLKIN